MATLWRAYKIKYEKYEISEKGNGIKGQTSFFISVLGFVAAVNIDQSSPN